ncbi:MAG: glycoside hydrolase/phage tail family protein [Pseudomonadota bacterium]
MRTSTTVIWATRFEETATRERVGSKGLGGGQSTTSYSYSTSFAVALCEGPINAIRRIWADGKELDQSEVQMRLYKGTQTQAPDDLIIRKQGAGNAPAYRGIAYLVFEDLQIERFGNRVPQIEVEVIRCVGELEQSLTAVSVIPGSTEHGLDPLAVQKKQGSQTLECNRHVTFGDSDWNASLSELLAMAPNLKHVSLVASWFADDLRAGRCKVRPGVVDRAGSGETTPWRVAGRDRASADVLKVSRHEERAAYGGTPTDGSMVRAIQDLKARGVAVTLNPFLLVDVPADNPLPDPYTAQVGQPAYPWRGRITCDPAPLQPGSSDKTVQGDSQIEAFCGTTTAQQFQMFGETVSASQSVDWCYRTFILHYAHLAMAAGGVDTFIIGSELRGLTRVRDDVDGFPFVAQLQALAADVRAIVGANTKIIYAADWSEYFGYQPVDGSGDLYFNLDPLWASPHIDAVAIDMYAPLSDWRDDDAHHADNPDGFLHHADLEGFKSQIESGEGFDWYFADDADRESRTRTPITDGTYGKPWVFRYKDLRSWWESAHYERRGGVELAQPTAWTPKAKKIWFAEVGCSALRGGARQPNLFPDGKSSENGKPKGVSGALSDAEQRALIRAHLSHWSDDHAASPDDCPVDPDRIYAWAWDARPYPSFPIAQSVWDDGDNWQSGHWLNGRLGTAPLTESLQQIARDFGIESVAIGDIPHVMDGLVVASPTDARSVIEPIAAAYDVFLRDDEPIGSPVRMQGTAHQASVVIPAHDLVLRDGEPKRNRVRAQADELPSSVTLSFRDPLSGYKRLTRVTRPAGLSGMYPVTVDAPGVTRDAVAQQVAHVWATRLLDRATRIDFCLPLRWIALQIGDVIVFGDDPERKRWLIESIDLGDCLTIQATGLGMDAAFAATPLVAPPSTSHLAGDFGSVPDHVFIDLPAVDGLADDKSFMIAARRNGGRATAVYASTTADSYTLRTSITENAVMGTLTTPLASGAVAVWDTANTISVSLPTGELSGASDEAVLDGTNLAAIEKAGEWEIIAFANAEEVQPNVWELTRLLRGLGGTEDLTAVSVETGAAFVLLNDAVRPAGLRHAEMGRAINMRVGEANRPFTGRYFQTTTLTAGVRARSPLAPVHVSAARSADALHLTWIRRTRRDGDSWEGVDVPLSEAFERYAVTIAAADATATYTAEVTDQTEVTVSFADLVGAGVDASGALTISVAQLSQSVGPGISTAVSVAAS